MNNIVSRAYKISKLPIVKNASIIKYNQRDIYEVFVEIELPSSSENTYSRSNMYYNGTFNSYNKAETGCLDFITSILNKSYKVKTDRLDTQRQIMNDIIDYSTRWND